MSDSNQNVGGGTQTLLRPRNETGSETIPVSNEAMGLRSEAILAPTRSALETFADRRARLLFMRGLAIGFVVFVSGMLVLVVADRFIRAETVWRVLASLLVDGLAIGTAWRFGIRESRQRDWAAIAQRMETTAPTLHEQMLSAVELGSSMAANGSIEFRSELQNQVANRVAELEVARMLPWRLIRRWSLAAIAMTVFVGLLSLVPAWQVPRRLARVMLPIAPIERASLTKIQIVRPTPPSRLVAEGDLVAVAVSVSQLGPGNVTLQLQTADGADETLLMSPRETMAFPSANRYDDSVEPTAPVGVATQAFAVNVQVYDTAVRYRVLAGDGVTLWHTLTPQPRPRMLSFDKRYQMPTYARLPDRTSVDEFGDLVGIVGTEANVVVTFDQPVNQVELLFGDGRSDTRVPVPALDQSNTQFQYRVPIKTPGSYRIDAVSLKSELNNPFSPRFSIDPIIDRAPIAQWSEGTLPRQIVSPAAVIDLPGTIEDDLPMDSFIQQFLLDDSEVIERRFAIQIDSSDANRIYSVSPLPNDELSETQAFNVTLRWDMMNYNGKNLPLPPGSQLKTRLIAIDRAGNRGASEWIHVFVAGGDFDASRHDELRKQQDFTRRVQSWMDDYSRFVEELIAANRKSKPGSENEQNVDPAWLLTLNGLQTSWEDLSGISGDEITESTTTAREEADSSNIAKQIARTNDSIEAERWVLLDRYVSTSLGELQAAFRRADEVKEDDESLSPSVQPQLMRDVTAAVSHARKTVKHVADFARWSLSVELAVGLMRDLQMIQSDVEIFADETATVPIERLPGQADLMVERLRQVSDLANSMQVDLPINTVRHQERLHRYLDDLTESIQQENQKLQFDQNPDVVVNFRNVMDEIVDELRYHRTTSLLQGDTFNQIASAVRELNRSDWMHHRAIQQLHVVSRDLQRADLMRERAQQQKDTSAIATATADQQYQQKRYQDHLESLVMRYTRAEALERIRRDSNVQEASDLKLVRRVIDAVNDEAFELPESQSIEGVIDAIQKASSILESGNQISRLKSQLQDVSDRERYGNDLADGAIRQGLRLEHYQVASEAPLQLLRDRGVDPKAMENLQATRWDSDFQRARQLTTQRRYESGPFVSATAPVQAIVDRYQGRMDAIESVMKDARNTLRQYLPTTGELARTAAEQAEKEAKQKQASKEPDVASGTEDSQNANTSEETTTAPKPSTPQESQAELQEKVDALAEDLADRANTADYEDESQRELARDADAVLATIQDHMAAVMAEEAASLANEEPSEAAEYDPTRPLKQLAETLRSAAEHFDAADAGKDLTASRQALRDASPLSDIEAAAQSADATARAANSSPEELLQRLEDRLRQDDVMKEELASISQQTAAAVEQAVRSAAKQERSLQQELEKADPTFLEKKRALRDQLQSLTDQSRAVNDHWLAMAESASGWNQDQDSREALRESREQLREAVDRATRIQNDQALLSELESTSRDLRQSLEAVVEDVGAVEDRAASRADDQVHPNEKTRLRKAHQLESSQKDTQNRWLKALDSDAKAWKQRRDQAGKRVQSAQNQQRTAERQLEQAKQQLKKHPDEQWAQKGVQESQERVDDTKRAAEQAKETRLAAEQAEKVASRRKDDARRSTVKDLNAKNPSAELLARVAKKSADELTRIAEDLKSMDDQSELADSLTPSNSTTRRLSEQQTQAGEVVRQAAEDLERAARHEERLGNQQVAEKLDQAAGQLQDTLNETMSQAKQALAQAGGLDPTTANPQLSRAAQQAGRQLGQAAVELASQAEQIAKIQDLLAAQAQAAMDAAANQHEQANARQADPMQADSSQPNTSQDDRNGAAPADPTPMKEISTGTLAEASKSEKLARTLDELDRGINQSATSQDAAAAEANESTASEQAGDASASSSQDAANQAAANQAAAKPSTAGQASPTLAASAEQAIRDLAAQRQQQIQQIASSGQPSDASSQDGESSGQSDSMSDNESGNPAEGEQGKPGTVSGDGSQMPGGGMVNANAQIRIDGEWGMLREQKNSDVIQDRKSRLPMSYRPAIEAYFQAISAEAAKSSSQVNPSSQPAGNR